MLRKISLFAILALTLANHVAAYQQKLHRRMSRSALSLAATQNDFFRRLDMTPADEANAHKWIEEGAHDEDFPATRVRNHFFNPNDKVGLTFPDRTRSFACSVQFTRADEWALDPAKGNNYTIEDANEHLVLAVLGPNPGTRAVHRNAVFETLGHVAHLVEDMAQPEHVRNDQHLTGSGWLLSQGASPSIWEAWSAANLTNGPNAYFDNYPVVKLGTFRDYFSGSAKGMADYAVRNFFTQDTNEHDERPPLGAPVGCYNFASPAVDRSTALTRTVSELYYVGGFLARGDFDETYYTGIVDDQVTGAVEEDRAQTVESLLDLETRMFGVKTYSLNEASYATRSAFLIPRSVGYAAGIIDRFFRGRIGAKFTSAVPGIYSMELTNKSSEALGADARVAVLYNSGPTSGSSDDLDIALGLTPLASVVPGFTGLAPGGSVTIDNISPQNLTLTDSLLTHDRHIVVVGSLGGEQAVIPLIQKGGRGLKVVMKWTTASNGEAPFFVIRENRNFNHLGVFYNFGSFRNEIPNTTLTIVSQNEAYFEINPIDPAGYGMSAALAGSSCAVTIDATVEWWAYGELVSTSNASMSACAIAFLGSYP